MTVASTQARFQYAGNGSTTSFGFPDVFVNAADLAIDLRDAGGAVVQSRRNGAGTYDYTLAATQDAGTGEYLAGSNIVFNTAPPTGYTVTIFRDPPATQSLVVGDRIATAALNTELDQLALLIQALADRASRSVMAPLSDPPAAPLTLLPAVAGRAGAILGFDVNGMPAAGPAGSLAYLAQLMTAPPVSGPNTPPLDVIQYGADPLGVADSTAAFQAAEAAAEARGGARITSSKAGTFKLTDQITIATDNIDWDMPEGTILNCAINNTTVGVNKALFSWTGTALASTTLTSNANEGDSTVQVTSAANMLVGRYLLFLVTHANGNLGGHVAEITSVAGSVIGLNAPIPRGGAVGSAESHSLVPFVPRKGIRLRGMVIDGTNSTGLNSGDPAISSSNRVLGVFGQYCVDCRVELKATNFGYANQTGGASSNDNRLFLNAVSLYFGYANQAQLTLDNCGCSGYADADIQYQTTGHYHVTSRRAAAFGPRVSQSSYLGSLTLNSQGALSRGIKLDGVISSNIQSLIGCHAGSVGVGITGGTSYNNIGQIVAIGNRGTAYPGAPANDTGVWFSGQASINNRIGQIVSFGNTKNDLEINDTDAYNSIGQLSATSDASVSVPTNPVPIIHNFTRAMPNGSILTSHHWQAPSGVEYFRVSRYDGAPANFTEAGGIAFQGTMTDLNPIDGVFIKAKLPVVAPASVRAQLVIAIKNAGAGSPDTFIFDPLAGFVPAADNAVPLGGAGNRWTVVYAATGAINTSDAAQKDIRGPVSPAELRAIERVTARIYRAVDAVAAKGSAARLHTGWTAQDWRDAFAAEGLDAALYGVFCSDKVTALVTRTRQVPRPVMTVIEVHGDRVSAPLIGPDGLPVTELVDEEYQVEEETGEVRLGLRYDEAAVMMLAYHRHRLDGIEARLAALEARP